MNERGIKTRIAGTDQKFGSQGSKVFAKSVEDKLTCFCTVRYIQVFHIVGSAVKKELAKFWGFDLIDCLQTPIVKSDITETEREYGPDHWRQDNVRRGP